MRLDLDRERRSLNEVQSFLESRSAVHFVGIGGIGMAGLANLLQESGIVVSGSDCAVNTQTHWLAELGANVFAGHNGVHVKDGVAWCVRSTAVPDTNPEILRCRERGIPVFMRGTVLAAFLSACRWGIAVSGTHGKTSTTAMIRHVLCAVNDEVGWFVGGEMVDVAVSNCGGQDLFVAEADESDGTVSLYHPDTLVVTNVEYDHMEHFDSVDHMEDCFRACISQTRGRVVFCGDDVSAKRLCESGPQAVSYGFDKGNQIHGVIVEECEKHLVFDVMEDGVRSGRLELPVHGAHNALNALAAYAVVRAYGVSFDVFRAAMGSYVPVGRRFEECGTVCGARVFSDYAHHPTEIRAVIRMAQQLGANRIHCVFQPHRYTRTLALREAYCDAFDGVDRLVLCPVYAASEKPIDGGTSHDLYEALKASCVYELHLADSLDDAWRICESEMRAGDVLLIVGAGDVDSLARGC